MFGGAGGRGNMDWEPAARPGSRKRKAPPQKVIFSCSLEDVYHGCHKKMRITRKRANPNDSSTKLVEFNVRPGWQTGIKITFAGEGDELFGASPVDIIFVFWIRPHQTFRREGSNLRHTARITLVEALCGTSVTLKGLDGNPIHVDIPDVITPGRTLRVAGRGMPSQKTGQIGDLIIDFDIAFPKRFSDQQKQFVRQLQLS